MASEYAEEKRTQISSHPTNYYQERTIAHTRRENCISQKVSKRLTRPNAQRDLGDNKLVEAVKGPEVYILRFWAREIVKQCKICQQVSAYSAKSNQGKRPRGEQPRV